MKNQVIRCQIESCQYISADHYCTLNSIKVMPCAPRGAAEVENRSDSMCANFVKKEVSIF